jgi:type IV pilus assembly protein PilP
MVKLTKIIMPVFIVLTLSACQQEKQDLNVFVAEVKLTPHADIAPIPVMKPYGTFVYVAAELRDPFVPTVIDIPANEENVKVVVDNGIHPDSQRLKEALEFYSLSELVLVGTLQQESDGIWALVRVPDGIIHQVQVGDYIGKNHGKVLTITDVDLTLKEIIPDNNGGYLEREGSLSAMN